MERRKHLLSVMTFWSDFQNLLRSAEAMCPLRIRNVDSRAKQHYLLHDVLLARFACEFQEEEGHFESAEKKDEE